MPSRPLVTAEELACLLQSESPATPMAAGSVDNTEGLLAQGGAALWLLKCLVLYIALQTLGLQSLPGSYWWARGVLEVLCCAVFWSALHQRARRPVALGAGLVGLTTLLMDALVLLALPG